MFYLLKEPYALRGWKNIPYALTDLNSGVIQPLSKQQYQTLALCNGRTDSLFLLKPHMQLIEYLQKKDIVLALPQPGALQKEQEYRRMPYHRLLKAHWSVTGKCNLRCRHCYMSAPQAKLGELTTEQCFYIVDQLAAADIHMVSLTGGEPLVRSDFWEIADRLLMRRVAISQIYTNGVLVNPHFIGELRTRGLRPEISMSYDGIGTHDWLRGVEGSEKRVLNAIRLLVSEGFRVTIEMSLNKKSVGRFAESIFLLAGLGVASIKATPTSDAGNWKEFHEKYSLSLEENYDAYLQFIKEYRAAGAPISVMLGGFFSCRKGSDAYQHPFKKFSGTEEMQKRPVCGSANTNLYISADGKLLPCIPLSGLPFQEQMPSILDSPLTELLTESSYLTAISVSLEELLARNAECNSCEYRLVCGGGCRAGALICGQPYLGKDEATCLFFKGGYEKKVRAIYNELPACSQADRS